MDRLMPPRRHRAFVSIVGAAIIPPCAPGRLGAESRDAVLAHATQSLEILRGRSTGIERGVVVLASSDAGWRGLAKDLGDKLAGLGYDVVGLDSKSYLTAGTRRAGSLTPEAVQEDYLGSSEPLVNGSPTVRSSSRGSPRGPGCRSWPRRTGVAAEVLGVVGLGTPDTVTLAWHFWNWTVGARRERRATSNGASFLSFLSVDVLVSKTVTTAGKRLRIGAQVFNVTNHRNPRDAFAVAGAPGFGSFANSVDPTLRGVMAVAW